MCVSLPHFVITRKDSESDPDVDVDADSDANATEVIVALCNYHVNQHLSVSRETSILIMSFFHSPCETGFSEKQN